jgi:hypothetical protein
MTAATLTIPDAPSATSDFPPDQHTLGRSILLHLLPGALILVAYLALSPLTAALGLPSLVALLFAVVVAAISAQLGHLLYQGYWRKAASRSKMSSSSGGARQPGSTCSSSH